MSRPSARASSCRSAAASLTGCVVDGARPRRAAGRSDQADHRGPRRRRRFCRTTSSGWRRGSPSTTPAASARRWPPRCRRWQRRCAGDKPRGFATVRMRGLTAQGDGHGGRRSTACDGHAARRPRSGRRSTLLAAAPDGIETASAWPQRGISRATLTAAAQRWGSSSFGTTSASIAIRSSARDADAVCRRARAAEPDGRSRTRPSTRCATLAGCAAASRSRCCTASPAAARPRSTCASRRTCARRGRGVLLLVPEIALTPAVAQHVPQRVRRARGDSAQRACRTASATINGTASAAATSTSSSARVQPSSRRSRDSA